MATGRAKPGTQGCLNVYEPDGRFLGSLTLPPRTTLFVFRDDRVWALRGGEFDEPYVVGFRSDVG